MDNNELLKKRISELSNRAFERGYTTYTDFLNIQEISILSSIKTNSVATLYGGYTNAERCICAFSDSEVFTHPITCIKAEPLNQKFSDKLTHRDFLGALMNLGIEREMIGDIKIIDNILSSNNTNKHISIINYWNKIFFCRYISWFTFWYLF